MKRILIISIITILSFSFYSCARMARVIKKTENSAIVQGIGRTKIEAKMNAEEQAKKIFVSYEEAEEMECTQEYSSRGSGNERSYSSRGRTYWSCVISIKKK